MSGRGTVERIHTAPESGAPVEPADSVEAVAGRGLREDRYFSDEGTFSAASGGDRGITLIEAEALDAVETDYGVDLEPGAHRRNVTRGTALNHLVGERFRVGDAECEGAELCESCAYLGRLLDAKGSGSRSSTAAVSARGSSRAAPSRWATASNRSEPGRGESHEPREPRASPTGGRLSAGRATAPRTGSAW